MAKAKEYTGDEHGFNVAARVIGIFGGKQRFSDLTGYPYSTVRSWERKLQTIPEIERAHVISVASANNIAVTAQTFIVHLQPAGSN